MVCHARTLNSCKIMPAKFARNDGQPRKRVKLDAVPLNAYRYSEGEGIERRLHVQTHDGLSEGELLLTLCTQTLLTFLFSQPSLYFGTNLQSSLAKVLYSLKTNAWLLCAVG